MTDYTLPEELLAFIGNEKIEFSAKAKRAHNRAGVFVFLGFAIVWSILPIVASVSYFGP